MFIISGTKHFKSVRGHVRATECCPNCQQDMNWEVVRAISFFTFFFIPLIPYAVRYYLSCPHCVASYKIKKKKAMELMANTGNIKKFEDNTYQNNDDISTIKQENYFTPNTQELCRCILPVDQMIKIERKTILRNYSILAVSAVLLFVISYRDSSWWLGFFVSIVAALTVLIGIPSSLIKLSLNSKRVPESIYVGSSSLRLGNQSIGLQHMKSIEMTSMKKTSSSIFPVQRYLIIRTDTKKERFWLGSQISLTDSEYAKICNMLGSISNSRNIRISY